MDRIYDRKTREAVNGEVPGMMRYSRRKRIIGTSESAGSTKRIKH